MYEHPKRAPTPPTSVAFLFLPLLSLPSTLVGFGQHILPELNELLSNLAHTA
ncbi:hypothetical protein MARPU_13380 [Marichromatium purpuratum 984]|uniref:Uncharacterized protein n=1 Tax=Marichromatium purpuratum 984 TaxID=765910 RepID=W0E8N9_MARPU|nr:hypothetical protein [Marichromatium purpuratum]AHF05604.1 hypothetical protein MARPU_13380 [Marichromatium purpuratum 984]